MKSGEPLPVSHLLDGRYRIHKVLGQGGMGRVYLANDTRLANRPVACKEMIIGDGIQEQKAVEDFNREARVLASLSHPSIPQVMDYFGEGGRHYLVMEFVAGGDLQAHLDALGVGGRFAEAPVVHWARQILDVLQFLHAQNPPIIYRDLKPGNIMIDNHGRAMLIDFGIARFLPPGGRGTQIGSVGYAPPEQYMGKMEPRSDLFSLAATMHHLMSGRDPQLEPPFSFPPLRALAPAVSIQTEQIVMRALDKDVIKRPRSAREMRDLLPNPGPEALALAGASGAGLAGTPNGAPANRAGGDSMGAMATIVLNRPAPPPSASAAPPANSMSAPRIATPAARPNATPSIAHQATQRSLKPPPSAAPKMPRTPVAPRPAVSSTAKTQDLGIKPARPPQSGPSASRPAVGKATPKAPGARGPVSPPTNPHPASPITKPDPARPAPARLANANGPSATPVKRPGAPGIHPALAAAAGSAPAAQRNGYAGGAAAVAGARMIAIGEGAQFALAGERCVIGRSSEAARAAGESLDIDLAELRRGIDRVSRRHAEIIRRGADYFIRDLGSLNGTFIAGRGRLGRDQLYQLEDHDEVVLGGARLEFRRG